MKDQIRRALQDQLLAMADDEFLLSHRNSEWCGHAPILEEDIAFANLALDEMGHALIWYQLHSDLAGEDRETYPDELVYRREIAGFRNVLLVEQPNGDWAFSMLRQYLFDAAETVRLRALLESEYRPIAEAAEKIQREELYHLRHTSLWVERLGLGTEESNRRMQRALDEIWPLAHQMFQPLPEEALLVEAGLVPDAAEMKDAWIAIVQPHLEVSDLSIPGAGTIRPPAARDQHSEHLREILADLHSVARAYPMESW